MELNFIAFSILYIIIMAFIQKVSAIWIGLVISITISFFFLNYYNNVFRKRKNAQKKKKEKWNKRSNIMFKSRKLKTKRVSHYLIYYDVVLKIVMAI